MVLRSDSLRILFFGALFWSMLLQGCAITESSAGDRLEVPARAELDRYLVDKPGSAVAMSLPAQIDTPPHKYFPSDYREVRLAPGQSFSKLSRRYLDGVRPHAL